MFKISPLPISDFIPTFRWAQDWSLVECIIWFENQNISNEAQNHFLIFRAQYTPYPVDVTISNVQIETAVPYESGLGIANFVEQCLCPKGYTGLSCEVSL